MIRAFRNLNRGKKPTAPPLKLGVCAHPFLIAEYGNSQDLQFSLMQEMGMTDYRFALPINSSGVVANTTKLFEIITKSSLLNISLFPILTTAVDFNLDEATNYASGFTRGSGFVAIYPNTFRYLEIGNEIENTLTPLTGDGSNLSHYNNTKYVRARSFIKGMIDGIKSVNASIKCVVDAGYKHWGYINQLIIDGCKIDVIAWHWYSDMESSYQGQIIQQLISLYPNIELWINEVNSRSQDDSAQSTWMTSFLAYTKSYSPRIRRLFVYELFDQPNHADSSERNYGLTTYVNTSTATYKPIGNYFKSLISSGNDLLPPETELKTVAIPAFTFGSYLQRGVIDPAFGTEVVNIGGGGNGGNMHYSKDCPMNITEEYIILGKTLHYGEQEGFAVKYSDMGGYFGSNPRWGYTEPNKYKFFMITVNGTLELVNAVNNTRETIYNFKTNGWGAFNANGSYIEGSVTLGSSEGAISRNDRYCVVQGKYGNSKLNTCCAVIDMVTKQRVSPVLDVSENFYDIDFATITPSGNYVFVRARVSSGTAVGARNMLYTSNMEYINDLPSGSHQDFGYDEFGNEIYASVLPCSYTILSQVTTTVSPSTPIFTNSQLSAIFVNKIGGHTSFIAGKPGWIVVGGWGAGGELLAINIHSKKVMRYAHMRGTGAPKQAEMTPSVSYTGRYAIFKTDKGISGGTILTFIASKPKNN